MQTSILVEPDSVIVERHTYTAADALAFTQGDAHVFSLLRAGPMRLTNVLNMTARLLPSRSKRQTLAVKHEILLRLGTLIRRGQLRRIKRKFVALPA